MLTTIKVTLTAVQMCHRVTPPTARRSWCPAPSPSPAPDVFAQVGQASPGPSHSPLSAQLVPRPAALPIAGRPRPVVCAPTERVRVASRKRLRPPPRARTFQPGGRVDRALPNECRVSRPSWVRSRAGSEHSVRGLVKPRVAPLPTTRSRRSVRPDTRSPLHRGSAAEAVLRRFSDCEMMALRNDRTFRARLRDVRRLQSMSGREAQTSVKFPTPENGGRALQEGEPPLAYTTTVVLSPKSGS